MNPLLRLLGAAASNGLLTGQIVFSTAFVGACELPNWIQAPREVNACRSRSPALALIFPSGMQTAVANNQPALAPGPAGGVPMSGPTPAGDTIEHFDPELAHHRAWLQAVLEQLVANEPQALEEGGTLRRLWSARQADAGTGRGAVPAPVAGIPAVVAVALPLVKEFEGCRLTAYPDPETSAAPWGGVLGDGAAAIGLPCRRRAVEAHPGGASPLRWPGRPGVNDVGGRARLSNRRQTLSPWGAGDGAAHHPALYCAGISLSSLLA